MNTTLIKTAAVVLVAAFAANGSAFAQSSTVDENIYTEITASQEKIFNLVSASTEERIAELQVKDDQTEAGESAQNQVPATS